MKTLFLRSWRPAHQGHFNYLANMNGGPVPNDVTLTVVNVVPGPGTWFGRLADFLSRWMLARVGT